MGKSNLPKKSQSAFLEPSRPPPPPTAPVLWSRTTLSPPPNHLTSFEASFFPFSHPPQACLVDLMAQQMVMFGQLKVGGGLYVLLYSSSMVWTAVLAQFVLKRELHYQQWMAVMEVMAGLVMSNLGLMLFDQGSSSGSSSPLMGSVVLLTGAMGAATYFISCEWILAGGADKSAPVCAVPTVPTLCVQFHVIGCNVLISEKDQRGVAMNLRHKS